MGARLSSHGGGKDSGNKSERQEKVKEGVTEKEEEGLQKCCF